MYKSPITIIESTIDSFAETVIEQRENAIFAKIQDSFGVDLDKHELIRALQYDRDQYKKGYQDGKADALAELVRCKDCIFCSFNSSNLSYKCTSYNGMHRRVEQDEFCSYGERLEE